MQNQIIERFHFLMVRLIICFFAAPYDAFSMSVRLREKALVRPSNGAPGWRASEESKMKSTK